MLNTKVGVKRIKEKYTEQTLVDNKAFSHIKPTILRWGKLPVMLSFATA